MWSLWSRTWPPSGLYTYLFSASPPGTQGTTETKQMENAYFRIMHMQIWSWVIADVPYWECLWFLLMYNTWYIYIFTNFMTMYMANILKLFWHANKQFLLREKECHSNIWQKKVYTTMKKIVASLDTLRLRRMEFV